jgi:hypothetical protein
VLFFFALSCGSSQQTVTSEFGSGSADEGACVAAEPGAYSRSTSDFLLGMKVFTMEKDLQSVTTPEGFKALGMNTVSLSFAIPFDENGNITYPYNSYGALYKSLDDGLCQIGNLVHSLKKEGLAVYLSGEPHYYNPQEGEEPPRLTEFEEDAVLTNFGEQLMPVLKGLAATAEKYKVEYVAPLSEPDKYLGPQTADTVMQDAKAQFEGYNGKLVWQVYGEMFRELEWADQQHRLNFSGYNTVGLAILGCDSARGDWDTYIDSVVAWAQEDEVSEIMNVEFGCVMKPNSEAYAQENLQHWYNKTSTYSKGLIVLDNPSSFPNSQGVGGTWFEEWVKAIAVEHGYL